MPNTIQAFPQNNTVSNNPTSGMGVNPATYLGNARPTLSLAQITAAIANFLTMLEQATGINLPGLVSIISGVGAGLGGIETDIQLIINALTGGGITGGTGNNPASILFALLNSVEAIPGDILQLLFGQQSTTAAQVIALQNNPGAAMSDNFATMGVSGYTNLVGPSTAYPTLGTLAVVNGAIQTVLESVAYRNVGPSTEQHGAHIVIGANMQGIIRIGISCDTAAANWCGLEVYSGFKGDCLRIVTGASPILTVVQAQLDLTGNQGVTTKLANGNTFDIWYQVSTNTFHVLRNGQPVGLDWPDLTNIVTHNSSKRKILVTSNGENLSTNGFYGPSISQIVCYDHS